MDFPSPRDVPTQRQQRTKAEIFQLRRGTYFSQTVELFRICKTLELSRICNVLLNARNRRSNATAAATCRHRMDLKRQGSSTRPVTKSFVGSTIRLRVSGVVIGVRNRGR